MQYINFPLVASLLGIFTAQVLKVPIYYAIRRKLDVGLVVSTGGMPSSHSAAVTSLATAIGMQDGFTSSVFAIAAVFAVITMFDATGVRRQAGEHSIVLNELIEYFNEKDVNIRNEKLKEMLGHKPIEVFCGGILGIVIAYYLGLII